MKFIHIVYQFVLINLLRPFKHTVLMGYFVVVLICQGGRFSSQLKGDQFSCTHIQFVQLAKCCSSLIDSVRAVRGAQFACVPRGLSKPVHREPEPVHGPPGPFKPVHSLEGPRDVSQPWGEPAPAPTLHKSKMFNF